MHNDDETEIFVEFRTVEDIGRNHAANLSKYVRKRKKTNEKRTRANERRTERERERERERENEQEKKGTIGKREEVSCI